MLLGRRFPTPNRDPVPTPRARWGQRGPANVGERAMRAPRRGALDPIRGRFVEAIEPQTEATPGTPVAGASQRFSRPAISSGSHSLNRYP